MFFVVDHQLHVLQHAKPEPEDGAGHPGDSQLPADRHAHRRLRPVCQGQVSIAMCAGRNGRMDGQ